MVRAPCCEKMGMKKGPWTPEEDQVLVDYIQQYGHGNWRALPKHAGLLRCGKSCRLRWTNYLRPDIKRGNFSREEEETVIELHGMLGNRWSAIAARLPGRTDNEIKNVWHTHLKKRAALRKNQLDLPEFSDPDQSAIDVSEFEKEQQLADQSETFPAHHPLIRSEGTITSCHVPLPVSPQQSCSDISSSLISTSCDNNYPYNNMFMDKVDSPGYFPETDESFWSDVLSSSTSSVGNNYIVTGDFTDLQPYDQYYPLSPLLAMEPVHAACSSSSSSSLNNMHDDMDFWYNLFKRAGEYSSDLPGI